MRSERGSQLIMQRHHEQKRLEGRQREKQSRGGGAAIEDEDQKNHCSEMEPKTTEVYFSI